MAVQIGVGRRHDFCPLGHVGINDEEEVEAAGSSLGFGVRRQETRPLLSERSESEGRRKEEDCFAPFILFPYTVLLPEKPGG